MRLLVTKWPPHRVKAKSTERCAQSARREEVGRAMCYETEVDVYKRLDEFTEQLKLVLH